MTDKLFSDSIHGMGSLIEIKRDADQLSFEDKAGLVTHLLNSFPVEEDKWVSDEEADSRDLEMDSGDVKPISHKDFLNQVGIK